MGPKSFRHTGPLELVVYVGGNDPKVHPLPSGGFVKLGRDNRNDIEIHDSSVSRNHALLYLGSDMRIEDRSSCNGTEVYKPGRYAETDTTISHHPERGRSFDVDIGDRIRLGSVILVIRNALFEPEKGSSGPRMWMEAPTVSDPLMEGLYEDVRIAAQTSSRLPILIFGETGVGKERVAQVIHDASPRRNRPFVAVNCKQFTETLVESTLFGHLKHSHSEAKSDKKGFLHTAHTGTLFLDEIADLSLDIQVKLLRFLDHGEVYPIGATHPDYVNVRVVAATNKDLYECVLRGTFREDLYYRLKGFEFVVPALRQRPKDIIPLAERFLADACRRDNQSHPFRLSETAIACLRNYSFPGNVRELKNAIEVASVLCRGATILPEHFPPEISKSAPKLPEPKNTPTLMPGSYEEEGAILLAALTRNGFNQKATAADLGICNRTLVNWLNRHPNIPRPKKNRNGASRRTRDAPPTAPNGNHQFSEL